MNQRWSAHWLAAAAVLVLVSTRPVLAAAPSGPWTNKDIGAPAVAGSTDVDATGVWTVKGGGDDIFNNADNFQYAFQSVIGDASITARLLSRSGGDTTWAKTGLMIRENDSDGSPNFNFPMTPGAGLNLTSRLVQGENCIHFSQVGPAGNGQTNIFMRLQRVGNEVAGFYSKDGQFWTQAGFSPVTLPTLGAEALFGLSACSHDNTKVATGKFDQVSIQPGAVSAYGILASGADGAVTLQWHALPEAAGFNLYRGPANLATGTPVKLNAQPVTGTSYTDTSSGLVNGTRVTYVIAPVFIGADGNPVEGPRVAVPATPVGVPQGWQGTSLNEGPIYGSVAIDPTSGQITMKGAGGDIWNATEQGYYYGQLVAGNFQITVQALTSPQSLNPNPRYGLMIRESLDGTARRAALLMTPGVGLAFQTRAGTAEYADENDPSAIAGNTLRAPVVLRLTRQGNTISSEYSTDSGKTFQPAGDPLTFDQDLPASLSVGLFMNSTDRFNLATAKLSDLQIQKLQP
jgi:hypothetical protein